MIEQRDPAQQLISLRLCNRLLAATRDARAGAMISRGRVARLGGAMALLVLLVGCHHKPVRPPLPIGVLAPVDLETPAPVENPPEIATLPQPDLRPLPIPEPAPPRRRPPAAPKEAEPAPPVQVAGNDAAAAELAIGAVSLGDNVTHTAQQAQDLINAVLRRIAALSPQIASAKKREVRQANNYLVQAEKAIKAGDAEGAHTLATKASLLMDEIEKK